MKDAFSGFGVVEWVTVIDAITHAIEEEQNNVYPDEERIAILGEFLFRAENHMSGK